MALTPGTTLGPYQIVAPLGAGGMGEVYKATDTRLDRAVAIKVLPAELSEDPEALARFEREAKAIAALSHPNILAIHDIGRDHGVSYAVTELLEGDTLRARLAVGALPPRKAVSYATQLAEELAAAHERGIVHRDVKPENVFIQRDGRVKLLDFGLARTDVGDELQADDETHLGATAPHTVMGTIGYMSPEQVRGERADARSDVFAFGAVLYELLSGRRAFAGPSAAEVHSAVLRNDPPALAQSGSRVPPRLERILRRCLEKGPGERFQSARDLAFALSDALDGVDTLGEAAAYPPPSLPRAPSPVVPSSDDPAPGAPAGHATVERARAEAESSRGVAGGTRPETSQASIAVLPFTDMSPQKDQGYFCEGIAEEILNTVARVKGLRVAARTSSFQAKAKDLGIAEIGARLKVGTVLEGSVRTAGDRVRVAAQLVSVSDGYQIWSERYDRRLEDVFDIQDDIARAIARALKGTLTAGEDASLSERQTRNLDAYTLYLKGRFFWNKRTASSLRQALQLFQEAVQLDPEYGPAHSGLADTYNLLGVLWVMPPVEAHPLARAAAQRALVLDETLAEAHTSLGFVYSAFEWNWGAAQREFQRAIELSPDYPSTRHFYAAYCLAPMGRLDEAVAEMRRAQSLDPLAPILGADTGCLLHWAQQDDEAIAQHLHTIEQFPDFPLTHYYLAHAYVQKDLHDEAITAAQKALSIAGDAALFVAGLGYALAASGRATEARQTLDGLIARKQTEPVPAYHLALICTGLGDADDAFVWLEQAYHERSWLPWLRVEAGFAPLRSDPRFADLVRRMHLPD